jgi:hypothetical protein
MERHAIPVSQPIKINYQSTENMRLIVLINGEIRANKVGQTGSITLTLGVGTFLLMMLGLPVGKETSTVAGSVTDASGNQMTSWELVPGM